MGNSSKIIADTCIWIEFFRTKSELSDRMKDFIASKLVAGTGMIFAELLQGVRLDKEREVIFDIFNTIDYIEITKDIWAEAGILAGKLRSKGLTIPLSDILLACCARKYKYSIFTIDNHFQDIPGINLI